MARKEKVNNNAVVDTSRMFGSGLSFASREAYKLLRTNILFALPDIEEDRAYHWRDQLSARRGQEY